MGNDIETIQVTIDFLMVIVAFGLVLAFAGFIGELIQMFRDYPQSWKKKG